MFDVVYHRLLPRNEPSDGRERFAKGTHHEAHASFNAEVFSRAASILAQHPGGVGIVVVVYLAIATIVVGHLDFRAIGLHSDYVLSATADAMVGGWGGVAVILAALLATSSAINATFYGSGRLSYLIARSGELPAELERSIHGQPLEGMLVFAALTLLTANLLPLRAIATMGSAGFLLVFLAVNLANAKLSDETGSRRWISLVAAASCAIALAALCGQTLSDPQTRWHVWVLAGMVALSLGVEVAYRLASGRTIHLGRGTDAEGPRD